MRMTNPGVFVYVRHGRNAWKQCQPGRFINPAGWERVERPRMFPAELVSVYKEAASLIGEGPPPQARGRAGRIF